MNKFTRIILKDNVVETELRKVETDDDQASMWEVDETSTVTNNLTFLMSHLRLPVDIIYEKSTNNILMFNIRLDDIADSHRLVLDFNIEGEELRAEFKPVDIEEQLKLLGIERCDSDGEKVFATPTYEYEDKDGNKAKIVLWLNKYGHRMNYMYLSFVH